MLRRNVSLAEVVSSQDEGDFVSDPDVVRPEPAPEPKPAPALDPLPRVPPSLARTPPPLETATLRIDPRPQSRRGGMEALRAEALQSVISRVEDRHFGGLRDRFQWKRNRVGSRVALALVALAAGGGAAWLSSRSGAPAPMPEPATVVAAPAPVTRVLVANDTIPIGHSLTVAALGWQDWPVDAVRPGYITDEAAPEAPLDMAGLIARADILPGEPIRQEKLAETGASLLATMLAPGMRGVSVSVTAESASGGFVAPNDRVDVVLTRTEPGRQASQTILTDVRVIAVNARLGGAGQASSGEDGGPGTPEVFGTQAIATLELAPAAAEILIDATSAGRLSLVLRPAAEGGGATQHGSAANQAIRLTSPFWTN